MDAKWLMHISFLCSGVIRVLQIFMRCLLRFFHRFKWKTAALSFIWMTHCKLGRKVNSDTDLFVWKMTSTSSDICKTVHCKIHTSFFPETTDLEIKWVHLTSILPLSMFIHFCRSQIQIQIHTQIQIHPVHFRTHTNSPAYLDLGARL